MCTPIFQVRCPVTTDPIAPTATGEEYCCKTTRVALSVASIAICVFSCCLFIATGSPIAAAVAILSALTAIVLFPPPVAPPPHHHGTAHHFPPSVVVLPPTRLVPPPPPPPPPIIVHHLPPSDPETRVHVGDHGTAYRPAPPPPPLPSAPPMPHRISSNFEPPIHPTTRNTSLYPSLTGDESESRTHVGNHRPERHPISSITPTTMPPSPAFPPQTNNGETRVRVGGGGVAMPSPQGDERVPVGKRHK